MTFDCIISTKDRYHTTLPLVMNAIATQTVKPRNLIIYDDGECKDLRNDPLYFNLLNLLHRNGIQWVITPGEHKGLSYNHQRSLTESDAEYLIRLDDDVIPEYDCFEALVNSISKDANIGAVGGQIVDPKQTDYSGYYSNKIDNIFYSNNIQWKPVDKNYAETHVDHLNGSCFIYNRIYALEVGYYDKLSPVCFREDTLITYGLKRRGKEVVYCAQAKCWHLNFSQGGNRSVQYIDSDEQYFKQKLNEWGINSKNLKLFVLDNGLGDHIVFLKVLPDIIKKYSKDYHLVFATCYPEVFSGCFIEQISIAKAKQMCDIEQYSIYKWMEDRNWKDSLEDAFRGMYL